MRREIEFAGYGGTLLRGWLYLPERPSRRPAPGVVMVHGFSAVKEMGLDRYAEVLCDAGLAVLAYDHRNLGASEGSPRQELNPWAQARDFRLAIGWLADRPEIDAERIGIWGSSYGAGEAIVVAACDERVKAVVANAPFAGYPGVDYSNSSARFDAIRDALEDRSGNGPADHPLSIVGPLPVVHDGSPSEAPMLDQSESSEWFLGFGERAPCWHNSVTLINALGTEPAWDPGVCIDHLAPTALLLVVATEDRLAETEVSQEAFARASEPKELAMIEGHHFAPYSGEGFDRSSAAARDFLTKHLGVA